MALFRYLLSDKALEVKLGPWLIRSVPFSGIEDVELGYTFWNEHWTNLWPPRFVTVRRRTGLFRNFVINPEDPESFAAKLRESIGK